MKNILALLLLIGFFSIPSYAQKMIPGYVLTGNGDSITGDISADIKNYSDSFLFREQNGKKTIYNTENCKGYGFFKSGEKYERWQATMDMSYFDKDFYLVNADSSKTTFLFLKKIYQGFPVSLYEYRDLTNNSKEHFFVKSGNSMEELIQKYREPTVSESLRPGKSPNYVIQNIFRDQLYKYFNWQADRKLKSKVDFAEYFSPALITIVKAINNEKQ